MSTDFNIRALMARDVDGVLAIATNCIEAPHWPRRVYEEILSPDPAALVIRCALVASSGGTLAGFAVANRSRVENLAELETIVVHPGFRHRGIGSGLLSSLMNSAGQAGASTMHLEVRESNTAARALYLAHGFLQAGRRRSYYTAPREDALLLEARLSPGAASPPISTGGGNSG